MKMNGRVMYATLFLLALALQHYLDQTDPTQKENSNGNTR